MLQSHKCRTSSSGLRGGRKGGRGRCVQGNNCHDLVVFCLQLLQPERSKLTGASSRNIASVQARQVKTSPVQERANFYPGIWT